MKSRYLAIALIVGIMPLGACQQQPAAPEAAPLTLQRGAQLLASGSPKSAIPFLTQTIAAAPDGPEPLALLSLAYALDLQDERAILEAQQVHRPQGQPAGWELVAVGIAKMLQHRPADAVAVLQQQIAGDNPDSPITPAARQWLVLAQILNNDHDKAIDTLQILAKSDSMKTTALLWTAIIQMQHDRKTELADTLSQCARLVVNSSGQLALQSNLAAADDQTLYDAAIAAIAAGDLETAQGLLARVRAHHAEAADAAIWMAFIAGVKHDWQAGRTQIKDACDTGSTPARGLANQLFAVICALEDRPDAMVQYTLAGQRLLGRNSTPAYIHEQPKPEPVWGSDYMK